MRGPHFGRFIVALAFLIAAVHSLLKGNTVSAVAAGAIGGAVIAPFFKGGKFDFYYDPYQDPAKMPAE